MSNEHILIVEDEEEILGLIRFHLERNGWTCSTAVTGNEGLAMAQALCPDLVLLDIMLPGLDGFQVCAHLKSNPRTRHIPVVMLTARGADSDIVRGLETGADDYVVKPFSPKVLVARLEAVLRRHPRKAGSADEPIRHSGLVIHPGRREALVDGEPVDLTFSEFAVLAFLARRPGWVFTRSQIVDAVHGEGHPVTDRSVDVQIVGLRKKLGVLGEMIETVRGVGYRFKE